jgi:putative membrane protein
MDWDWGFGPLEFVMFSLPFAFWILVVVVAVALIRRRPGEEGPRRGSPALELLEERYARGEIDRDEFLERRAVLEREEARS